MGEEKSDNEIIELYKNGEKEALKYLIERYASPIFNFVAHLTNRNDAPDIVQDIFIKTQKKRVSKLGFLLLPETLSLIFGEKRKIFYLLKLKNLFLKIYQMKTCCQMKFCRN